MHTKSGDGLPFQRAGIESRIQRARQLTDQQKDRLIQLLHQMPEGDGICHGDYHPDNIIMSAHGPVIIDWPTVTQGNPLADAARTLLLMRSPARPPGIGQLEWQLVQVGQFVSHRMYLHEYCRRLPASREQIEAWLPIQAAARLTEGVDGEEAWLMKFVESGLMTQTP